MAVHMYYMPSCLPDIMPWLHTCLILRYGLAVLHGLRPPLACHLPCNHAHHSAPPPPPLPLAAVPPRLLLPDMDVDSDARPTSPRMMLADFADLDPWIQAKRQLRAGK